MRAREAKEILLKKRSKPVLSLEGATSTGSTLLNLACTDREGFGFLKAGYYFLVGDSQSGKTFFSLTCLAEANRNPAFDGYEFVFDDVEGGALMDFDKYFGKGTAKRLRAPAYRKGKPVNSETIEQFYNHISTLLDERRRFIYILDSQDALGSKSAQKKFKEARDAMAKGTETTGSYGDGKAKYHSENLRHIIAGLRKTKSILIIIGQTRDNLGFGFNPKTRSGGKSLRFYANLEIWSSVIGTIKRKIRGKDRTLGNRILLEVKKNRVTGKCGKDKSVEVLIYPGYGIDDIGSCVDYIIAEGHWKRQKGDKREKGPKIYEAPELMFSGTKSEIIRHIEEEDLETKVQEVTGKLWREIEAECEPKRKMRYE
jgi:RecA/RadA recombinase